MSNKTSHPNDQKIVILNTGGTFMQTKDKEDGTLKTDNKSLNNLKIALEKQLKFDKMMNNIQFEECEQNVQCDSSNRTIGHWNIIANAITKIIRKGYRGVVVIHGTDTLTYTSAALAFALSASLRKPVVMTGSQVAMGEEGTDAFDNLYGACLFAFHNEGFPLIPAVTCYFGGKLLSASRLNKVDAVNVNAFSSLTSFMAKLDGDLFEIDLLKVRKIIWSRLVRLYGQNTLEGRLAQMGASFYSYKELENMIQYLEEYDTRNQTQNQDINFCTKVALLQLYPGFDVNLIRTLMNSDPKYEGIVLVGYGSSNGPITLKPVIEEAIKRGTVIVGCSGCHTPSTESNYEVSLKKQGAISGRDMYPQALFAKLALILGLTHVEGELPDELRSKDHDGEENWSDLYHKVNKEIQRSFAGEISMSRNQAVKASVIKSEKMHLIMADGGNTVKSVTWTMEKEEVTLRSKL